MRRHEQCRHLRAHAHEAAMPILRRPRDRHRDIRARPARRPGRGCHNLEPPLTGLQRRRRSAPSAAGSLRAAEVSDLRRTARNTGILSPSTAASQTARASRALATSRRITTRSPNAFYPATADEAEPSNPHRSGSCNLHPAGSFPGGFWTLAPVHLAATVIACIRSSSQKRNLEVN